MVQSQTTTSPPCYLKECNGKKQVLHKDRISALHEDRISALPDEILVDILSRLPINEATRTSVLSTPWRHLWKFSTNVNFDRSLISQMLSKRQPDSAAIVKYVNCVDRVLERHKAQTLEQFCVDFSFGGLDLQDDIDNWLKFAVERRVRSLHFDLSPTIGTSPEGSYTLTQELLPKSYLHSLTALHLNCVELSSEVLDHILCSCSSLEVLSIITSRSLLDVKLCAASPLKLKYLDIQLCHRLASIQVASAPNLVSFVYRCGRTNTSISIEQVPRLSEVSIDGANARSLIENFVQQHGCWLSQLETLALNLDSVDWMWFREQNWSYRIPKFPEMTNLRQLKLKVHTTSLDNLQFCSSLLRASPLLSALIIRISRFPISSPGWEQTIDKHPHNALKKVELIGFVGDAMDNMLVEFLLNTAVALEKLIIDPNYWEKRYPHSRYCQENILLGRSRAKELEKELPPQVDLVIL